MSTEWRPDPYLAFLERFTIACAGDDDVLAAFLGGSRATAEADRHSDIDLYLITSDGGYESFLNRSTEFMQGLGELLFLEHIDEFGFDMLIFLYEDGIEGELALASARKFDHIHGGPFRTLVDKNGVLEGVAFPLLGPSEEEQRQTLRQLIVWFWRDVSLAATALARGNLWTGYGYLEALRRRCLNLVRLERDFERWPQGYDRIERGVPEDALAPLEEVAFPPLDRPHMLSAIKALIRFYRPRAQELARAHDLSYPARLDRKVSATLEEVMDT